MVLMKLQPRFLPIPGQSFFLFGPCGTGKSTWLRHCFPEALFVDLLRPDVYRDMQARPERLIELILGAPNKDTVVVDEVQRVPELLNVVHDLIERPGLQRRFVLTGSSTQKLWRGGVTCWPDVPYCVRCIRLWPLSSRSFSLTALYSGGSYRWWSLLRSQTKS
jgi:predicted AAA+ superfamily ATPase